MLRYGKFPMGLGNHLKFKVHPPVENVGDAEELIAKVEKQIVSGIFSSK